MVTSVAAMDIAIKKARQAGIGMAGVYNSCHFGAAGYYAVMAARAGLIGLVTSNDIPSMTAPGARGRIMGTNPFAFAAPAGEEKPIFLDMAMSTVAGGKVHAAKLLGKTIPDNWLVDENGLHTNNPADFDKGALQPMGAHKGYGLALMAETLAGLLTGAQIRNEVLAWMGNEPSRPTGHGACFIAIDVASMLPIDAFRQRMDAMIRDIRAQPKATGMDRIYMPGELEWGRQEKAAREGILLPPDVAQLLSALASETGVRLKSMQ
jgi:LDH2 family malate/lactate/ureidoglycolate dehydrogenase